MPKLDQEELRKRVDQVLWNVWDPIGVNSSPEARDEYRSHTKKVAEMLNNGRDAYAVADYLRQLESGWLGSANEQRLSKVVSLLFSHKDEVERGRA